jgi:type III pantothenate kinase
MNLVIDAGNTAVKLAVFDQNRILSQSRVELSDFERSIEDLLEEFPKISHGIIASVAHLSKKQLDSIAAKCRLLSVDLRLRFPFKIHYNSQETLGADRLALAVAAVSHHPNQNILVIDSGTCITYDMVNDQGAYLGGAISPGLDMRYRALHDYTARLPLLEPKGFSDFIGDSTENSIHSGVVNGLCREIDGVIDQYQSRYEHLTVILTGGDAQFLSKRLKNAIFAHSNFLLEGLNFLLEYNKR